MAKRILVIDDEPGMLAALRRMLEREGFEVDVASGGAEGVRRQREAPAEVVIVDVLMPEMDGIETMIQIRKEHPETRILAMSGGGLLRAQDCLKLATPLADGTLSKPINRRALLEALAELTAE